MPANSDLNSGHPGCTTPPPAALGAGAPHPLSPSLYCSPDDKAHVPPYSPSWWGVGGLFVWLPLSQTHASIWRTRVLSKEKGNGEGGATFGHYSRRGGGEKTRCAGHLWCVSVIWSDWGFSALTHTHFMVLKESLSFVLPFFCVRDAYWGGFTRLPMPPLCSKVESAKRKKSVRLKEAVEAERDCKSVLCPSKSPLLAAVF